VSSVQLRDYQIEALRALWRYWRAGGGNPLIELATGLGKSLLIAELGRRFCAHDRRIAILSHVREIIEQDAKAILALWPEAETRIGIMVRQLQFVRHRIQPARKSSMICRRSSLGVVPTMVAQLRR
jgi:superfamily II DNA or RNA helicase